MTFPQNHHPKLSQPLQYKKYPCLKPRFTSDSTPPPHYMFYSPNNHNCHTYFQPYFGKPNGTMNRIDYSNFVTLPTNGTSIGGHNAACLDLLLDIRHLDILGVCHTHNMAAQPQFGEQSTVNGGKDGSTLNRG